MLDQFLWLFVPLLFAHLLTDFLLQSDASVREKSRIPVLIRHGLTAGLLSYLFPGLITSWQIPLGTAISHILLDAWKMRTAKPSRLTRFILDQSGHVLVAGLFSWAATLSITGVSLWKIVFGPGYLAVLAALSGMILVVYVGSFIVELSFESLGIKGQGGSEAEEQISPEMAQEAGIPEGGRIIGYLERGLILIFILAGYPAGIGFLVAAKSIFRFGELTDSNRRWQAEYIIIGTLLSILYGTAVSFLIAELLHLILS